MRVCNDLAHFLAHPRGWQDLASEQNGVIAGRSTYTGP